MIHLIIDVVGIVGLFMICFPIAITLFGLILVGFDELIRRIT